MKKFLSLALAIVMALSLAACGGASSDSSDSTVADSGKKYIIATDTTFAPFEFTDENSDFVGIDVDILAAVAKDQGFDYELQPLGFDAAVAALESGQADGTIAGMSITDERKEKYDFSTAYYDSYVCVAAKARSGLKSLDDLKGKKVAAKTGTMGSDCAYSLQEQYGYEIVDFADSDMMYQDVLTGNTAACFEDEPVMAYNITQGNGMEIIDEQKENYSTPYGFAVLKDQNTELLEMFNAGLQNIIDNGTYDEIVAKYTATK